MRPMREWGSLSVWNARWHKVADFTAGNMPRLSQVQPEPHPSAMDRQKGTGIGTEIGELWVKGAFQKTADIQTLATGKSWKWHHVIHSFYVCHVFGIGVSDELSTNVHLYWHITLNNNHYRKQGHIVCIWQHTAVYLALNADWKRGPESESNVDSFRTAARRNSHNHTIQHPTSNFFQFICK